MPTYFLGLASTCGCRDEDTVELETGMVDIIGFVFMRSARWREVRGRDEMGRGWNVWRGW